MHAVRDGDSVDGSAYSRAMTSASSIVVAARDLADLIEANADDGERIRRLPLTTVKALNDAQLLRMCVPAAYGGPEVDPVTSATLSLSSITRISSRLSDATG